MAMKFFRWSVDYHPEQDPIQNMDNEVVGVLAKLRRIAAVEDCEVGRVSFHGRGNDKKFMATYLGVTVEHLEAIYGKLIDVGELLMMNDGTPYLKKWEEEQRHFFAERERLRLQQQKRRQRKRELEEMENDV